MQRSGGTETDRSDITVELRRDMDLPSTVGCNGGGWGAGGGDLFAFRQNNVTQYIVTRPIMDLCLPVACRPGARV